jgi:hypothetical protein
MQYTMSKKELAKLTLVQGAIEGVYTVSEVAKRCGLRKTPVGLTPYVGFFSATCWPAAMLYGRAKTSYTAGMLCAIFLKFL